MGDITVLNYVKDNMNEYKMLYIIKMTIQTANKHIYLWDPLLVV